MAVVDDTHEPVPPKLWNISGFRLPAVEFTGWEHLFFLTTPQIPSPFKIGSAFRLMNILSLFISFGIASIQ
jgi:hypothetical protein